MRVLVVAFVLFSSLTVKGQNLLLNGGFEDTIPAIFGQVDPAFWSKPSAGTPDFFTPFNGGALDVPQNFTGFQYAHSGSNYLGILMYTIYAGSGGNTLFREYIQNQLTRVLVQDSIYCLQLFVSLADSSIYASKNKLGVYFSATRIQSNNSNYLPYTPQIMVSPDSFITEKQSWLEYNFQYKAIGGERYITIGNFTDSSSVDTLNVGGGNQFWNQDTYYYIDDVYLGSCDSVPVYSNVGLQHWSLIQRSHNLFPNPATHQVNLYFEVNPNEQFSFLLFDLQGRLVQEQQLHAGKEHQIPLELINNGLYLYQIRNEKGEFLSGKLVVE